MKIAETFGWSLKEVYKAKDSWRKLYSRQPNSEITFDEYISLMVCSGLRPDMVGLSNGKFQLSRFRDSGVYKLGNCRFLRQYLNQAESSREWMKEEGFRKKASDIAKARPKLVCGHCAKAVSPGMHARWHGDNCKRKVYP